jgi:Arc/MetJ-type ribon-helix-helix transcriptional regulator
MQKTTSVSLGDHFESFITHQIEAGQLGQSVKSAVDLVR